MIEHRIEYVGTQHSRIVLGRGVTAGLAAELAAKGGAVAVLTQPPVARLAADLASTFADAATGVSIRELPDREAAKSLGVVEDTLRWLSARGIGRGDTIVGIGGGALTDVTGFVAATYLRGVDAVYVPTTLLGAVDASIGGKTGVNVDGKNLAGAFRHPSLVLIDIDVLDQLPSELLREGAAEVLKAGLIADPVIVERYEAHGMDAPLEELVERAVAVKVDVVRSDFLERERRAILNYGHTIGHAVEVAGAMPHGHAVAVGMVAAGHASELVSGFGAAERQRSVIERLGLPTSATGLDRAEVMRLVALDKKRSGNELRMVLLGGIGHPEVKAVDDATVLAALAAVGIT
jgi:3-dehydroquinate synthase